MNTGVINIKIQCHLMNFVAKEEGMIQRMINPFKKIKFYLINPETGKLKITYLCDNCGKEMEEPDYWRVNK